MCLFSSYKITLPVLHINQSPCVRLRSLSWSCSLLTQPVPSAQVWPPLGYTDVADFVHSASWYQIRLQTPKNLLFFCRIKGLPCYIWRGFLLPSVLHSVVFHSSISPVFPPWRRRNFNSKKMDSIVLCIIWKTPCGMNCAILIFIISNADNRVDLSRKDWLADYCSTWHIIWW